MKTLEFNHNNNRLDKVLNAWPFCLEHESIKPLVRLGVCRVEKMWHLWWTTSPGTSLFYNGAFFFRFMLPFFVGVHIRWGVRYLQIAIGWKLNGRFGLVFRVQSDKSAATGTHGPNYGQANGWECGPK